MFQYNSLGYRWEILSFFSIETPEPTPSILISAIERKKALVVPNIRPKRSEFTKAQEVARSSKIHILSAFRYVSCGVFKRLHA